MPLHRIRFTDPETGANGRVSMYEGWARVADVLHAGGYQDVRVENASTEREVYRPENATETRQELIAEIRELL